MTPAEARRFLESCNDEIEAGMTDDLARRIIAAHAILAADLQATREAEFAAARAAAEAAPERPAPPGLCESPAVFRGAAGARDPKNPAASDDSELFLLIAAWGEADAAESVLWDARDEAEAALAVELPDAARVRDGDAGLFGFATVPALGAGYDGDWIAARREYFAWMRDEPGPTNWTPAIARFDEIARALAAFDAARERRAEALGLPDLERRLAAARAQNGRARAEICAARAATLAGVLAKLRVYAARHLESIELEIAESLAAGAVSDDDVMRSALRDAARLSAAATSFGGWDAAPTSGGQ